MHAYTIGGFACLLAGREADVNVVRTRLDALAGLVGARRGQESVISGSRELSPNPTRWRRVHAIITRTSQGRHKDVTSRAPKGRQ
jgi:hypothetical protein